LNDTTTNFREIGKERVLGRLPVKLHEKIREEAWRTRSSISAVLTRYVCFGMGVDPIEFGLANQSTATSSA
jgi:hypothetical protein